jgi:SAM-dependent methyltransferase
MSGGSSFEALQGAGHGEDHDYTPGSPHLAHAPLRDRISDDIRASIQATLATKGSCRVLEVGAGHGTFSQIAANLGAQATITEMSEASAAELRRRFAGRPGITVVHDHDGAQVFDLEPGFDLALYISVIHHIPDYLDHLSRVVDLLAPGAAMITYQDPTWYPRRHRRDHWGERAAYLSWRVTQGNLLRGATTTARRLRGVLDESNPSDMVEYHVVRHGVDQDAIMALLTPRFDAVTLHTYWSSQGGVQHRLGQRLGLRNTFGILASGKHG